MRTPYWPQKARQPKTLPIRAKGDDSCLFKNVPRGTPINLPNTCPMCGDPHTSNSPVGSFYCGGVIKRSSTLSTDNRDVYTISCDNFTYTDA